MSNPLNDARVVALRVLAIREHSCFELKCKLDKKGFDEHVIDLIINECEKYNYLNDERFTEIFINSRRAKGKGPIHIKNDLQQRQVSVDLISTYLDLSDVEWIGCATRVREKKFGKEIPEDYKEKMRQARFLEYRGFTNEQIFSVF